MLSQNLSLQDGTTDSGQTPELVVLGEVLWDILPGGPCLGGAPLNFAVHATRLGFRPLLISAVGADDLGKRARLALENLDIQASMIRTTERFRTGTATVGLDEHGEPTFTIDRPAAYDAVRITDSDLTRLVALAPAWVYYGTLFASTAEGRETLVRLLDALPGANRFYDVNLRPGFDSSRLVLELLGRSSVVKLNEAELAAVSQMSGLPSGIEEFCRIGTDRFGWTAVCITLGARGCAILRGVEYARVVGYPVAVADSVGAGDAFAAALLHGLTQCWPLDGVAAFANRVGAIVASRVGATPVWDLAEAAAL